MHEWHALPKGQVLKELSTDPVQGLSHPEASQRLQRYGANRLDPPGRVLRCCAFWTR